MKYLQNLHLSTSYSMACSCTEKLITVEDRPPVKTEMIFEMREQAIE